MIERVGVRQTKDNGYHKNHEPLVAVSLLQSIDEYTTKQELFTYSSKKEIKNKDDIVNECDTINDFSVTLGIQKNSGTGEQQKK